MLLKLSAVHAVWSHLIKYTKKRALNWERDVETSCLCDKKERITIQSEKKNITDLAHFFLLQNNIKQKMGLIGFKMQVCNS